MKTHKRTKKSRMRGGRACGWGFRQKHKGTGNKGGVGMSGSSAHKRQKARESDPNKKYFGKQGLTSRSTKRKKDDKINLYSIKQNFFKKDNQKIELKTYKILAEGNGFKAEITARAASKSAIEKMKAAGGKIIITEKKKTAAVEETEEEEESEEDEEEEE